MTPVHIRIFYPADPVGVVPGGVDTFLRGLIKWAPADLVFSLVGMTTDPTARPAGQWTVCQLGDRTFDFFPVVTVRNSGGRGLLPLSLRFTLATWWYRAKLRAGFDVFDFHRPEPSLLFLADQRPKNAYFHNDPQTIGSQHSDNLWRKLPAIYQALENRAVNALSSAWCVRESGVQILRERYPALASAIQFIPTWVDADVFSCANQPTRLDLRHALARTHGLDVHAQWLITVGRLDTQKDPLLMLSAFAALRAQGRQVIWLVVGDGVLRPELSAAVDQAHVRPYVHFLGLQPPAAIADLFRAADTYALSSAYEGMPMALLEALGCGLPAAVTDVGEVRRVVLPGVNGAIATARDVPAFTQALAQVLDNAAAWRGSATQAAVQDYQPAKVLTVAYANYRKLGQGVAKLREAVTTPVVDDSPRQRTSVVGALIDLGSRDLVRSRLMAWAGAHQSRTVCFCNVHSVVQASFDERHRLALLEADHVAPDGAPIAWTLRLQSGTPQERVDGPGTMLLLCADAQAQGVKVGLYGASPTTLQALVENLKKAFPQLDIAYQYSPPFRDLTDDEDTAVCQTIAQAGVGLLFVGLGCPKQEYWLAQHRGRIPAVMLGVGAAFDFHAGTASRAPAWMGDLGLEWTHRLLTNPRRLWRRYLFSNSMFLGMTVKTAWSQVARRRAHRSPMSVELPAPTHPTNLKP